MSAPFQREVSHFFQVQVRSFVRSPWGSANCAAKGPEVEIRDG